MASKLKIVIQSGYSNAERYGKNILNSRRVEWSSLWPVAELGRVASDADPLGVRGGGAVKDEQHVPTGRGDVGVWGCFDCTIVAAACHLGENDTGSHQVTMGAGGSGDKRDPHVCRGTLEEVDINVVSLAVLPILVNDSVCGLGPSIGQIGRNIDFNSEFLRVFLTVIRQVGLGVGARDKDATVVEEDRLGVIQASNNG